MTIQDIEYKTVYDKDGYCYKVPVTALAVTDEAMEDKPLVDKTLPKEYRDIDPEERWRRPRALTDDVVDRICECVKKRLYIVDACAIAGISKATYYNWLAQAQAGNPFLQKFLERLELAEAVCQQNSLKAIEQYAVARDSWEAEMTFLERRFPKKWARQSVTTHQVDEETQMAWEKIFGWYQGIKGQPVPEGIEEVGQPVLLGEVSEVPSDMGTIEPSI